MSLIEITRIIGGAGEGMPIRVMGDDMSEPDDGRELFWARSGSASKTFFEWVLAK